MGGAISSIFGGGYDAPDPVQYDPVPVREAESEPESRAVREAERRKLRARRSMGGTLLTSPLTTTLGGSTGNSGLLGRTIGG